MTTSATVYASPSMPVVDRVAVTHGNPHDQRNPHHRRREREREGANRLFADVSAMASRSGRHDTAGAARRRHGLPDFAGGDQRGTFAGLQRANCAPRGVEVVRRTQTAGGNPVRIRPPVDEHRDNAHLEMRYASRVRRTA